MHLKHISINALKCSAGGVRPDASHIATQRCDELLYLPIYIYISCTYSGSYFRIYIYIKQLYIYIFYIKEGFKTNVTTSLQVQFRVKLHTFLGIIYVHISIYKRSAAEAVQEIKVTAALHNIIYKHTRTQTAKWIVVGPRVTLVKTICLLYIYIYIYNVHSTHVQ